jgi:putative aldouronate transport system substrate-binding protein
MEMKRLVFLVLLTVMCLAVISAAGSRDVGESEVQGRVGSGYFHKYEPGITLTGNRISSATVDFVNNAYVEWAEEELGITYKLKWTAPDAETDRQKLTLAMASNDLPDIISIESGDLFARMAKSGVLKPLNDLLDTYASPLTNERIEVYQEALNGNFFSLFQVQGDIYAMPEASDVFSSNWYALWMRGDILAELGMEAPDTIEEYEAVLAAYSEAYPGNVGMVFNQTPIMEAYGAFPKKWVKDGNGGLEYGSVQPEARSALEKLNSWYENGYLDKEYFIKDDSKNREPMIAGNALSIYGNWWYVLWPFPDLWVNVPAADMVPLMPLSGPDGDKAIMHDINNGYFGSGRAISASCEHPEALVFMLNQELDSQFRFDGTLREKMKAVGYEFMYPYEQWQQPVNPDAPQEEQVWNYQVEGPDKFWNSFVGNPANLPFGFKYNEGPYDLLNRYLVTAEAYRNDAIDTLSIPDQIDYTEYFSTPVSKMEAHVRNVEMYDLIKDEGIIIYNEFTTAPTPSMVDRQAYLEKIEEEYYTKIITGELPVSAFDTFTKEWEKAGGADITSEVNEWYKAK